MTVFVVVTDRGCDDCDSPIGVYSTPQAAREAASAYLDASLIYELPMDAPAADVYVPLPDEPRHWWDDLARKGKGDA
jgi:hypothetical protein